MPKGVMGILTAVIGSIMVIIVLYELMNAVDTSSWASGVSTIIKTVVALAVAIGAAFFALKSMA